MSQALKPAKFEIDFRGGSVPAASVEFGAVVDAFSEELSRVDGPLIVPEKMLLASFLTWLTQSGVEHSGELLVVKSSPEQE